MPSEVIDCARCGDALPEGAPGLASSVSCSRCGAEWTLVTFPALHRTAVTGAPAEVVLEEGESACFYHPTKRAVVPCDRCGRFLCALCDVELDGKQLCPGCLETARDAGSMRMLERTRTRYDQIVWSLLIVPLPLCAVAAPLTASVALVLALRHWRSPPSLVANTRLRLGLALLVGLIELGVAAWFWGWSLSRSQAHVAK